MNRAGATTYQVLSRPAHGQCHYCWRHYTKLCDYPVDRDQGPGTCDVPMCDACATPGGVGIDHCKAHAAACKRKGLSS